MINKGRKYNGNTDYQKGNPNPFRTQDILGTVRIINDKDCGNKKNGDTKYQTNQNAWIEKVSESKRYNADSEYPSEDILIFV
jgi:hypothetical protein